MPFHVDDEKFDAPGGIPVNLYLYGTSLAVFGGPMNEAVKQCYHRLIPAGYFYGFLSKYKHLYDHGTFALEVDEKGYAPPVGDEDGHLLLHCLDGDGHLLKGTRASPMRVSMCFRYANSKPEDLEMHAKAVKVLESEPMSDLEEEFVEEAQGASKGASKAKGASAKKRGSKAEVLEAVAPKRSRTQQGFFNEEFFPRGWKGSGVDNTFGWPTEDCVVYTSIWQAEDQKLARGLTFIVHSNDGTSSEVMVLLVYKHIPNSRMFAVCTDRPNNGTAAEWAPPDICSAPRLLKVDLVRPSSPFRGKFPFSTLELQAFMTSQSTARESFKYRAFWNSAVAPNAVKPHTKPPKKPPKKPRVEDIADEQPSTDDDLLPGTGTLQTRGNKFGITPAAFNNLMDKTISSALSSSAHALIAQHVRANTEAENKRANTKAETKRANTEAENKRAKMEVEFQRAKMEAEFQSATALATAERERERAVEQSRLREAEEERNRKERERAQEQLAYDRSQLAEARKQVEADMQYLKQALIQQQSVQAATLGMSMSSNYYHAGSYQPMPGAHPGPQTQLQALGSIAQASAALQPLLTHASEEPAQLRLTDVPNVPGVLVAPLPDVVTWLLHQRIVAKADEVDLEKLSGFGVVDGPDVLCLSGEELANVGFKPLAVRKLLNLKAKELEKVL